MSDREAFLRRFHAARPGITSAALGHTESYDRLVAAVPAGGRVLDLGCGDAHLVRRLGPRAIGVDLAPAPAAMLAPAAAMAPAPAAMAPAPAAKLVAPAVMLAPAAAMTPAPAAMAPAPAALAAAPAAMTAAPAAMTAAPAAMMAAAPAPAAMLVAGRAQALPFADASFDACVCHLAFMLFDALDQVVAELRRVVVPGGTFAAVLGGGPTAAAHPADDAFHRFLAIAAPRGPSLGDRRARSEAGWRQLFDAQPRFERFELDLTGTFASVWRFLGASYQLTDAAAVQAELRASYADLTRVPCRVVMWLGTVQLRPAPAPRRAEPLS